MNESKAVIEGWQIVIRVPVKNLPVVVEAGPHSENIRVVNSMKAAKDIVLALNDEDEDGTTPIHRIFDKAIEVAYEMGSEGLNDK